LHLAQISHSKDDAMNEPDRPDLRQVRHHLKWLFSVIIVAVFGFLALTFYLYARFTEGITLAP
jgi:hypothetical protein